MTAPYREAPPLRLWEYSDFIVDLDRISLCIWDDEDDLPGAERLLSVYFMGDEEALELDLDVGQHLLEAWRIYRRG